MPRSDAVDDWREILIAVAALETGLLEAFGDGRTPGEAAREAGLDARASRIVGLALAAFGYLEEVPGGRLAPTARGRALLAPPGPDEDPAGDLHLSARAIGFHLRLPEALRAGVPPDDVSGGDAAQRERFLRAMRHIASARAPGAVAAIGPPPPGGRLLDVGGAPGTYARALAAAGWDVTVADLPEALAVGGGDLEAAGIATVAADATEALPEGPWDAVYMGNLVHLFDRDAAASLIARAGAALRPRGLLAVQEVLRDMSPQGPAFGVTMLLATPGGDAYALPDYRDWMAAAGCPIERTVPLDEGWHHLLLGRRAAP